jgi:hypothetical protein
MNLQLRQRYINRTIPPFIAVFPLLIDFAYFYSCPGLTLTPSGTAAYAVNFSLK